MASDYLPLLTAVRHRLKPPTLIALGAPRAAADLSAALGDEVTCFQMDCYQAGRLRAELADTGPVAEVITGADLWDLPPRFGSVVYPSPPRGERELKLDVVEQAFHILKPHGMLAVLSPVHRDRLFPDLLKKVFDKVALETSDHGTVLWSARHGERKRRRHEVTFSAKVGEGDYREFLSRPGIFSYGRIDDGTRALLDVIETRPGERLLDMGCGCGVAGIIAALRAGTGSHVTLADSNARAVAVARINAEKHALADVRTVVTADFAELRDRDFDLVLANPPYFAQQSIAQRFAEQAARLLKPGGRFYLVTRQIDEIEPMLSDIFGPPVVLERRGYFILVSGQLTGRRK